MGALDLIPWWPVDAVAGGVVRRAEPARDATRRGGAPGATVVDDVGDIERPFAWASLTKLLVTMAVLVAAEEGTISLDEAAGPPGSTVRHLLAHASGLGPDSPIPVAGVARMRIYSNIGYEILADTLARHAGMSFADYLAGRVLDPLRMTATSLAPGRSPASGAEGPLHDLLVLAIEVMAPTIVSAATLTSATSVAFPGLRGVLPGYGRFDPCDWGLGFEVKGAKDPHWTGTLTSAATYGHFGRAGGFLWVDPVIGIACATLSNKEFGPWAIAEWSALADAVVGQWTAAVDEEVARAERRERMAADTERLEQERLESERLEQEHLESERRQRQAAEAKAEAERLEQHRLEQERVEGERRERLAAEGELRRRAAAEVERRQAREAAAAEAADAQRREREAAETDRRSREAARTEAAETERRHREEAAGERRVAAMSERRDTVETRVADTPTTDAPDEEVGPLGPGIRPVDFWGVGTS